EQAFPGVKLEVQGFASASLLIPRVETERQAGVFSWDVAQITIQSLLTTLKPRGVFDPLRPALIRPDVTGDQFWNGGFDASFVDKERQFAFLMAEEAGGQFWINTDLVKDGEITTIQDLLNPRWKGKMMIQDVRAGSFTTFHAVRTNAGDEVVRKILIDQAPVFSRDPRQITDGLVRGQYAIVRGVNDSYLQELRDKGVGKNVKAVDIPEARIVNSSGGLWLFNRAPHPNAAKLFVNWILTKEGAAAWCGANVWNS
ncbi:MAG: extracellular solute-binding protein, partial [Chloroflexota bacterium]